MRNDQNAFPVTYGSDGVEHGMTLRDYFAAAALQGLIVSNPDWEEDWVAHNAYLYADWMLKERNEKNKTRIAKIGA
jgi:hypothetical protein